jgi:hypothetical protein
MVSTGTDQSIGMKSYGEKADRKKAGMEQGVSPAQVRFHAVKWLRRLSHRRRAEACPGWQQKGGSK